MKRLLTCAAFLVLLFVPPALAQEEQLLRPAQLVELYGDASDELSNAEAEELLLMLCNSERRAAGLHGLAALKLPAYAARRHAGEMARLGYGSHYDTQGRNPVERYNQLGGTDYVQENLIYLEIDWPLLLTERLVRSFHREWLASPRHRETMLSPQATHMGCAFELARDGTTHRMAAVCEFVSELGDYSRLPQRAAAGELLEISGQLVKGVEAGYIGIGLDDARGRMEVAELLELPRFYSLPEEQFQIPLIEDGYDSQTRVPPGLTELSIKPEGSFSLQLEIPADWAGRTVYFYIFAIPDDDAGLRCIACQTVRVGS